VTSQPSGAGFLARKGQTMDMIDELLVNASPYFDIFAPNGALYMRRWWVKKPTVENPWGVRLHCTYKDDAERDFHDHPWPSTSLVLRNNLIEMTPADQSQPCAMDEDHWEKKLYKPGSLITRTAGDRHRLLIPGEPVWTLFTMGSWERDWGFHSADKGKWVYWREYLDDWTTNTSSDNAEKARIIRALGEAK
jgi:hypothetical protein